MENVFRLKTLCWRIPRRCIMLINCLAIHYSEQHLINSVFGSVNGKLLRFVAITFVLFIYRPRALLCTHDWIASRWRFTSALVRRTDQTSQPTSTHSTSLFKLNQIHILTGINETSYYLARFKCLLSASSSVWYVITGIIYI